jgi:hypothetical protein
LPPALFLGSRSALSSRYRQIDGLAKIYDGAGCFSLTPKELFGTTAPELSLMRDAFEKVSQLREGWRFIGAELESDSL